MLVIVKADWMAFPHVLVMAVAMALYLTAMRTADLGVRDALEVTAMVLPHAICLAAENC